MEELPEEPPPLVFPAVDERPGITEIPPQDAQPPEVQEPAIIAQERPPFQVPTETRERHIYFTMVERDGQILPSRVSRTLEVSDSPMQDALNALLAGPSAEEINSGLRNLIPQNTRILSAFIRGSTAYINFSEDFQFNTYGVEGHAAQVRQIVWTATEFPTVRDVQILIEGRRVDFLGEGIWIGSPIDRHAL